MKKLKLPLSLLLLTTLNLLAMIVGLSLLGNHVPMHMNINMVIDAMGSPWWAIFLPIVAVLCAIGLFIELKIRGEDYKNLKYLNIILYSISILFVYLGWLVFAFQASGLQIGDKIQVSLEMMIGIPIGFLFMIMGNYMPVIKQNKTLGIKTFSTLSSVEIWTKTHRLCGFLAVTSGFLMVVFAIAAGLSKISWLFFGALIYAVIASAIVPMIYARVLYNKTKTKTTNDNEKIN